ncbi:MAG: hypothetical protein FD123_1169 [Bacteroidetes bacterium]|nr:MAG: hypothetical protein FD123_1169 [Bacteroidota bacterium]
MFWKHTRWAFFWALLIAILCGIPGRDIPHISFLEMLAFDKWVHAGVFFVLVILLARGLIIQNKFAFARKHGKLIALSCCVVYGGILELLQGAIFVERSADIYDFIANSFGAVSAFLLFNFLVAKIRFLHLNSNHG